MFRQTRLAGVAAAAKAADLIDDYPAVAEWIAPYSVESDEPSGYEGLEPYWSILDAREQIIANVFSQDAARAACRAFNAQPAYVESADASPVVIVFKRPGL